MGSHAFSDPFTTIATTEKLPSKTDNKSDKTDTGAVVDEVKDEPPPSVSQSATNIPDTNTPSDLPLRMKTQRMSQRAPPTPPPPPSALPEIEDTDSTPPSMRTTTHPARPQGALSWTTSPQRLRRSATLTRNSKTTSESPRGSIIRSMPRVETTTLSTQSAGLVVKVVTTTAGVVMEAVVIRVVEKRHYRLHRNHCFIWTEGL